MDQSNNEIFVLFFKTLKSLKFIAVFSFLSILILLIILVNIDNKYESTAVLHASEKESDLASMASQFSGLAAIAGVTVSGSDEISNSEIALEVLKSKDFFLRLYEHPEFLLNLMAYDSFDPLSKLSTYKNKEYDVINNKWVRNVSYPKEVIPSINEAYKQFFKENFLISKDETSGIITLSVIHESPFIAQEWLNFIIFNINDFMRNIEVSRAQKALDFLKTQMSTSANSELLKVLANMAEAKYQTIMLSEVSDEFVFRTIQKPSFSNFKKSPNRAYLAVFFSLFAVIFFSSFALIAASYNKKIDIKLFPPMTSLEKL